MRLLPFLIPIFSKDGLINPKVARALGSAMWMYDLTGGARIGKLHKRLKKAEAVAHMPTLPEDRLAGGYLYYDAAADDARLTLTLVRTAVLDHGAVAANHAGRRRAPATTTARPPARSSRPTGSASRCAARAVVNAAGVWSDDVRALDEGGDPDSIRPAKGIHITVPWDKVRNDIAVVVPVPKDKRSVFVVPWLPTDDGGFELTYIGTTDTDYDGPIDDPQCTADDIAYLLKAINFSVREPLSEADVVGHLGRAAAAREGGVERAHRRPLATATGSPGPTSGVITVTGGKLTTYREMAEDTVDELVEHLDGLPRSARRCRTADLKVRGAQAVDPQASGLTRHLADRYGTEARVLHALIAEDASLGAPLVRRAARTCAPRPSTRRATRWPRPSTTSGPTHPRPPAGAGGVGARRLRDVAALMAPELGWSPEEAASQADAYVALVAAERDAPGLVEPRVRSRA